MIEDNVKKYSKIIKLVNSGKFNTVANAINNGHITNNDMKDIFAFILDDILASNNDNLYKALRDNGIEIKCDYFVYLLNVNVDTAIKFFYYYVDNKENDIDCIYKFFTTFFDKIELYDESSKEHYISESIKMFKYVIKFISKIEYKYILLIQHIILYADKFDRLDIVIELLRYIVVTDKSLSDKILFEIVDEFATHRYKNRLSDNDVLNGLKIILQDIDYSRLFYNNKLITDLINLFTDMVTRKYDKSTIFFYSENKNDLKYLDILLKHVVKDLSNKKTLFNFISLIFNERIGGINEYILSKILNNKDILMKVVNTLDPKMMNDVTYKVVKDKLNVDRDEDYYIVRNLLL